MLGEAGENYTVSIVDFGPGISQDDQKHIFDSFYRSKNVKKVSGFGLGLAISKKIIEAHRGKFSLDSQAGKGSTFLIVLPKEGR